MQQAFPAARAAGAAGKPARPPPEATPEGTSRRDDRDEGGDGLLWRGGAVRL